MSASRSPKQVDELIDRPRLNRSPLPLTSQPTTANPLDICLLLRAHGEQRWLLSEVLPVLIQLEQPGSIPDDQRGAALAYLEVLWIDAHLRAADTDAAHAALHATNSQRNPAMRSNAHRYHAAVRRQRHAIARRIAALSEPRDPRDHACDRWSDSAREHASS
jgi:hypothetical protein